MTFSKATLDFIFGEDSEGTTPAARAATSKHDYVRSQVQIARASPKAKGRVMNAMEAFETYGIDVLKRIASDGAARLIANAHEPAVTLRTRREQLRLTMAAVARAVGATESEVDLAETPGKVTPYRLLQKIAEALSLDERLLSCVPGAHGDERLGAKLRDLRSVATSNDAFVTAISESAWVVGRQVELQTKLGIGNEALSKFDRSDDYKKPVANRGYVLAYRTRRLLGLQDDEPIISVRQLAERMLGVPVVETKLGSDIAGATISSGSTRGIALSDGLTAQSQVLFRRMTLAHELGHLLWDPDARLEPVQVDEIKDIGGTSKAFDEVEGRANAFAVALLAPVQAVKMIHRDANSPSQALLEIVRRFGISAPAARFHLKNVCRVRLEDIDIPTTTKAAHAIWNVHEGTGASEAYGIPGMPRLRGGRFAELTRAAQLRRLISEDTAASWLRIDAAELDKIKAEPIGQALPGTEAEVA